jgi:hypothetical protein
LVCLLRIYTVKQAEFGSRPGRPQARPSGVISAAENGHPVHQPREVFLIVGLEFAANIWASLMHHGILAAGLIQVKPPGAGLIERRPARADLFLRT